MFIIILYTTKLYCSKHNIEVLTFQFKILRDPALLDAEKSSLESRCAFSMAISIALTQLLPIMEEIECKRLAKFLHNLAEKGVIECPFKKAQKGPLAYSSIISYSCYLIKNRSVAHWMSSESFQVFEENLNILLKPLIALAKKSQDPTLLFAISQICCDSKIKEPLINCLIAFKGMKDGIEYYIHLNR